MSKKYYIKPVIKRIVLDNTISLQMQSPPPDGNSPPERPEANGSKGGSSDPFASPFGDKPFN